MRTHCPSPSLRSRSCQVTSQPLERCAAGPRRRPPCRSPHTHTSAAAAHAAGTLRAAMPACPGHRPSSWGPSGSLLRGLGVARGLPAKPGDVPMSPGAWQCPGFSPSGLQGTPPSSPVLWPPRCCQHPRMPLHPAGTPAPLLSQPLQEPGVPISAPPHARLAVVLCPVPPGGGLWRVTGQDQALPTSLPGHWGGEGAGTLLRSWAGSVSSHHKSFLAGPVI